MAGSDETTDNAPVRSRGQKRRRPPPTVVADGAKRTEADAIMSIATREGVNPTPACPNTTSKPKLDRATDASKRIKHSDTVFVGMNAKNKYAVVMGDTQNLRSLMCSTDYAPVKPMPIANGGYEKCVLMKGDGDHRQCIAHNAKRKKIDLAAICGHDPLYKLWAGVFSPNTKREVRSLGFHPFILTIAVDEITAVQQIARTFEKYFENVTPPVGVIEVLRQRNKVHEIASCDAAP